MNTPEKTPAPNPAMESETALTQEGTPSYIERATEPHSISRAAKMLLAQPDVRAMACELLKMPQADMTEIIYDNSIPVVVRRFAISLLQSDTKEVIAIIDQAYGKPVERQIKVAQQANPYKELSSKQLDALLEMAEAESGSTNNSLFDGKEATL